MEIYNAYIYMLLTYTMEKNKKKFLQYLQKVITLSIINCNY